MGEGCATSSVDLNLSLSCYDHDRHQANQNRSDHELSCLSLGILNSNPLFSHSLTKADMVEETKAMEEDTGPKKKLKLSSQQISVLEEYFRANNTLNGKQKKDLGNKLKLQPRQVEVWFQNRRARTKLKQIEADSELLRKYCKTLEEENRVLKRELQRLRDRGNDSSTSVCPSCEISRA